MLVSHDPVFSFYIYSDFLVIPIEPPPSLDKRTLEVDSIGISDLGQTVEFFD